MPWCLVWQVPWAQKVMSVLVDLLEFSDSMVTKVHDLYAGKVSVSRQSLPRTEAVTDTTIAMYWI